MTTLNVAKVFEDLPRIWAGFLQDWDRTMRSRNHPDHEWKRAGADTGDLMLVLGWTSDAMPRHYGRSAAAERALETQQRLGIGERV